MITGLLRLPNPSNTLNPTAKGGYLKTASASTQPLIAGILSDFSIAFGNNSFALQNFSSTREKYLNSAVLAFQNAILSNMVGGQAAVAIKTDNIRMSLQRPLLSTLHNYVLIPPSSPDESYFKFTAPRITLGQSGLDDCFSGQKYASVAVTHWGRQYPYASQMNYKTTNPFTTSLLSITTSAVPNPVRSGDPYFVTLQYTGPQFFGPIGTKNVLPGCAVYKGSSNFSLDLCACSAYAYTATSATLKCAEVSNLCSLSSSGIFGENLKMNTFVGAPKAVTSAMPPTPTPTTIVVAADNNTNSSMGYAIYLIIIVPVVFCMGGVIFLYLNVISRRKRGQSQSQSGGLPSLISPSHQPVPSTMLAPAMIPYEALEPSIDNAVSSDLTLWEGDPTSNVPLGGSKEVAPKSYAPVKVHMELLT